MKILIIDERGQVTSTKATPGKEATYTESDKTAIRIHLSETKKVTKSQVKKLGDILDTVGRGKTLTSVTQHSPNTLCFTIAKEADGTKSKASVQAAYNIIFAEAQRVNTQQGQQGQQGQQQGQQHGQQQGQQQNQQQGQQQNQQQGQQQNQQQGQQQGQQQNQQQGQQQNQQHGQQQNQQQGQQQNQQRSKRNKPGNPDFDRKKDYFWRDFGPENFWPGMTQAEKDKVYDEYWAMVDHVNSIFS